LQHLAPHAGTRLDLDQYAAALHTQNPWMRGQRVPKSSALIQEGAELEGS